MDVSLDLLRAFLALHGSGSVPAAARQVRLAPSVLKGGVRNLELELGQTLFVWRTDSVESTRAADQLAYQLTDPLRTIDQALSGELPEVALSSAVHLGGPTELITSVILPGLADLLRDGLRLEIRLGPSDGLLAALRSGRLDLAIADVQPDGPDLVSEPIGHEELVLVANPYWLNDVRMPVSADNVPEVLAEVPLIAYCEPMLRRYWLEACGTTLERSCDLVVPDARGALAAVEAGGGASVLPRHICAKPLKCGDVAVVCEPDSPPANSYFLVRRADAAGYLALSTVRSRILRQGRLWERRG